MLFDVKINFNVRINKMATVSQIYLNLITGFDKEEF